MHIFDMLQKIFRAFFKCVKIFRTQLRLRHAAVIFQRAHRRDNNHAVRLQAAEPAFNVHKFLRAQIRAETRLGDRVVAELHRKPRRLYAVAAVRNIRKRSSVDKAGRIFQRLHEIRLYRVLHQGAHRALRLQIPRINRRAVVIISDDNITEPLFQVGQTIGKAQNRHNFRRNGNHKPVLARFAVHLAAERDNSLPERAVVHIEHAFPDNIRRVDAERIALVNMVVNHSAQKVIRRGNRVHIPGEMQVYVLHRHYLGIAAARRAALYAHNRSERRLAQGEHAFFPEPRQCVAEPDRSRSFALARRGRVYRRDQNELSVGLFHRRSNRIRADFRLVSAVLLNVLLAYSELCRNLFYREHFRALRYLNIT